MLDWVKEQVTYMNGNCRIWTKAEKLYLLAHANEKTFEQIAEDLGRTENAVKQAYYGSNTKKHILRDYRSEVLGLIEEGKTTEEIADELGFAHQSVCNYLQKEKLWQKYKEKRRPKQVR